MLKGVKNQASTLSQKLRQGPWSDTPSTTSAAKPSATGAATATERAAPVEADKPSAAPQELHDGIEAAKKAPPPPAAASHGARRFTSSSPLMARFAPMPTLHEDLASDDPRHALRTLGAPKPNPVEQHDTLPARARDLSTALGIVQGATLATAAATKFTKASAASAYLNGDKGAQLTVGAGGAAGAFVMMLGNGVSAFQNWKAMRSLKDLKDIATEEKTLAHAAAARGEPGMAEHAGSMERAEKLFDKLIEDTHEQLKEKRGDALTDANDVVHSSIYAAGEAAAEFASPIGLAIRSMREARTAVSAHKDAKKVHARKESIEPAIDATIDALNARVQAFNADPKNAGMQAKDYGREHLPDALNAFTDKETRRLDARESRLERRAGYDGAVAVGAGVAAIGYGVSEPITAGVGYGVMSASSVAKSFEGLFRALKKEKRHEAREAIYQDLTRMLRDGPDDQRQAGAVLLEKYTNGMIKADDDVLKNPEQAMDFLRAMEKSDFK
jgi:hypothetical protein